MNQASIGSVNLSAHLRSSPARAVALAALIFGAGVSTLEHQHKILHEQQLAPQVEVSFGCSQHHPAGFETVTHSHAASCVRCLADARQRSTTGEVAAVPAPVATAEVPSDASPTRLPKPSPRPSTSRDPPIR